MYESNEIVNQNVPDEQVTHQDVSCTREVELDIVVLEERIAPGVKLNRIETMSRDQEPSEVVKLDIQVLEERIAPSRFISFWSTSGDADDRPTEEVAFHY